MKNFIEQATRTESPKFACENPRLLHAAVGCVTESGEMLDALKKHMYYGKHLDIVNVLEEAGDILWYLAILFDELDTDFATEQRRVIEKLKSRFPDKFTVKNAFERDINAERKVLEGV